MLFPNPSSFLFPLFCCWFSCVAIGVSAAGVENATHQVVAQQLQEIVPPDAREFYESLTDQDREVLQKVISKGPTYSSVGEVLADLRNGSTTLYDRAVQLVTSMRQTIAKLSAPARSFVDESVQQIREVLALPFSLKGFQGEAAKLVKRYRALDSGTKGELNRAFPVVASMLNNSIVQTLASGLLNIPAGE